MAPATPGRAAVPPAPTPIREGQTRQGKCCVSSSRANCPGTARAILALERAKHSRHHAKDKQGFVVSVVAYDSAPGHHIVFASVRSCPPASISPNYLNELTPSRGV